MKTKAEIVASLPERFREFAEVSVWDVYPDVDQANAAWLYAECRYQELLKAFQKLMEKYS